MQYRLEICCELPRCKCPQCGVKTITAPWAEAYSRNIFFEIYAIQVLRASMSITQARELLDMSWGAVQEVIGNAVERGLAKREKKDITFAGIDEKSFRSCQADVPPIFVFSVKM
jgi:transposase